MSIHVESYGTTDAGKQREKNEDQFFIAELSGSMKVHHTSVSIDDFSTVIGKTQGYLFLVADGLGGHAAGDRASALAISAVSTYAVNRLQLLSCALDSEEAAKELHAIADECHKRLAQSARNNPNEYGMATTVTLAIVIWPDLYVMHVGDSRCYLLREEKIEQLTRDHTLGQLCSEFGDALELGSGSNNALWNVVGSQQEANPVPDVIQKELQPNDELILCTDGLYNHVSDEQLVEVMSKKQSNENTAEELVALANADGGSDNITVVLSRFSSVSNSSTHEPMVETRIPRRAVFEKPASSPNLRDTDRFVIARPDGDG